MVFGLLLRIMNYSKTLFSLACLCSSLLCQSQNLQTIESIEYDPIQGRFLVSNSNSVVHVDGNGNGVSTLPSPIAAAYGMEIFNNQLFAIHSNRVKVFDLATNALIQTVNITGAGFLNGMASDGVSKVWVTDFSAKKIHQIDFTDLANPITTVLSNNTTTTPNGIVYDEANNRLVFVSWGSNAPIKALDLTDNTITTLTTTTLGNCDGIDKDGLGNYFVASWSPNRITKYSADFAVSEIITVAGGLSSAADICYANENDTLAIPNSGNTTVVYVGFDNTPNSINTFINHAGFNTATFSDHWEISTHGAVQTNIHYLLLDNQGKVIISNNWLLENTTNRLIVPNQSLPNGTYFLVMVDNKLPAIKLSKM
jgi:sugar lactone lactonase YvrE